MREITVIIEQLQEIEVQVEGELIAEPIIPDLLAFYELAKIQGNL